MYRKRLLDLGICADLKGFEFLNCAIQMYKPTQKITDLYIDIAEIYNTLPKRVERAMRTAISKTNQEIKVGQFIAKYKILWEEN